MPRLLPVVAVLALALAGCDSGGEKAIAHVGKQTITKEQLERTVEHFREEAKNEGKPFPAEGSAGLKQAEDRLLALLVYRAELADQAQTMGIRVADDQVEKRAGAGGSEAEADKEGRAFARDSVRAQLLYEAIYSKVTASAAGNTPQAAAKRNRLATRFIERMKRDYAKNKVRYEPGYAPGS